MARYSYAYGTALYALGESSRALEVLKEAHERLPGDSELVIGIITISREVGDLDTSIDYARRLVELLPGDPEARRLLEELEAESRDPLKNPG